MTNQQYLLITKEQFEIGYNYNFTNMVKQDYSGSDYISWANAFRIMKELFPHFHAEIEKEEYVANKLVDRSYLKEELAKLEARIETCNDYKEKKKLAAKLEDYNNQYLYDSRGSILYPRIVDLSTGQVSPSIQFPLMVKTNDSSLNGDSRVINDGTQRALVKAIAIITGIGYRLFTREGVDLDINNKSSDKDHPKYKSLLRVRQLIDQVEAKTSLPVDFIQPHFGMPLSEIISIGKQLRELANTAEPIHEAKVYETWKTPKDMIAWGKEQLAAEDDVIKALIESIEPDDSHSKKIPFYNRVLELVN